MKTAEEWMNEMKVWSVAAVMCVQLDAQDQLHERAENAEAALNEQRSRAEKAEAEVKRLRKILGDMESEYASALAQCSDRETEVRRLREAVSKARDFIAKVNDDYPRVRRDDYGLYTGSDPERDELLDVLEEALEVKP